ncbi:hypothetical protein CYMTET_41673 [Cymbomonas tetramitiformis]|uniref:Polycystin cation channel PKD1/PKD2 domain-containing protein n=1 Tax=Cymbomonas tetramitiformis TaxID=36881 RepID=A0AAE0C5L6_9CHLO|nr:hypothetical protein CYMTET_41673 [Cymbomonas tetramitiformis]
MAACDSYYDFDALADINELLKRVHAILIFVFMLTTFKYMNASPVYGIVVRTILRAGPALFQFFLMFFICFAVFAIMGVVLFGHIIYTFSNLSRSCKTLVMMVTGEYGMDEIENADRLFGPLYYGLFLIIVYFLLINILLAILMNAYMSLVDNNALTEEKEKLNLSINLFKEFYLQSVNYVYWVTCKVLKIECHQRFLTNEAMIQLLIFDEALLNKCMKVPAQPTMADPEPEDHLLMNYDLLESHFDSKKAKELLMFLGEDVDNLEEHIQRKLKS